jgi:hypothetical protein
MMLHLVVLLKGTDGEGLFGGLAIRVRAPSFSIAVDGRGTGGDQSLEQVL